MSASPPGTTPTFGRNAICRHSSLCSVTAPRVTIPPPTTVRIAGVLVVLQGIGLVVLAGVTVASGIAHHARAAQLGAQGGYFVVLGILLGLVAAGLWRGRRWSRTPALVAQVVVIAVGMWMAFPSGQLRWGVGLIVAGAVTFGLLVSPGANHWIRQFPRPFGPGPDR